ncbi:MoxR family ATPase [Planctomycetales bacterium ZRK34]|nr:MoxR family ATPase [Planctomycetales bacterium ZRK34]
MNHGPTSQVTAAGEAARLVESPQQGLDRVRQNLRSVIRGKDEQIDLLLAALLAQGHVLIEDLPGLGKTTLAKALALSLDAQFRRVQFTPDLLPTDVLGGSVYNATEGSFAFHKGPIFTNILLADEINRASPRTQSSLLEAMGEGQATIEGVRYKLPVPFMVVATQNPIEFHGTYPLPEAQLDRFLIVMKLDYADADTERRILFDQQREHPLTGLGSVVDCDAIVTLQQQVREVHVADEIGKYIVELVRATRQHAKAAMGASPRGALGLFRMAQAKALMAGRDHAQPDDVQQVAPAVLAHRIVLETKARYAGQDKTAIISEVIDATRVPT